MRRLLIVEDEFHIREGLRHLIQQTGLPIEIVGAMEDGESALQAYRILRPDIVLLDINLPDLSGLEVARTIRENDEETQLLFLTGYNSIAFIRDAIALDTADYMLKPISKEELAAGLIRAEERIRRRMRLENHSERRDQIRYMTQEYALFDLLLQRRTWEDAHEALVAIDSPLLNAAPPYALLCCELDDVPSRNANAEDCQLQPQLCGGSYAKLALEAARLSAPAYGVAIDLERFVLVLTSVKRETVLHAAQSVRAALQRDLTMSVTIGASRAVAELKRLPEAYREALYAAEHKGWVGNGQIIPYDSIQVVETSNRQLLDKEFVLLSEIRIGNERAVQAILEEWAEQMRGLSARQIRLTATQLVLYVMRVVQNSSATLPGRPDGLSRDPLFEMAQIADGPEMIRFLTDYFVRVSGWIRESRESVVPKLFEDAKHWLRAHLHEDASLNGLADYLHLSPKYVSSRFKQVTGESFAEFLARIRFERARELLLDPERKTSDIAAAVGYSDTNYFSIAFKKNTGFTPSEFRRRYL